MHEALLETLQPEEQHGFRKQRRLDEPWLSATLLLDKVLDKRIPVWVVRLDQQKILDKANWNALWFALAQTD